MSDKSKMIVADGPVLFYSKDGILYPTALTDDQLQVLKITCGIIGPITIMKDHPQGQAVNLLDKPAQSATRIIGD